MAKTPKYPNPAFFRAKDNMDWKAQGENLKEVFDIAKDMLLATDWKAFGARQKQGWIDFAKRVAEEASEIAAMSCAERRELLLKGEKKLGRLYKKAEAAGMSRERTDARILEKYKKQDPATLTRQEYDEICNSLDAAAAQHNQQGGQA